jgi:hypothetical protein
MNCATERTLTPSRPQGRGKQTHDKVDPKMERVRRVESWASDEPFGTKRHPPCVKKKSKASKQIDQLLLSRAFRISGTGGKTPRTRRIARPCRAR